MMEADDNAPEDQTSAPRSESQTNGHWRPTPPNSSVTPPPIDTDITYVSSVDSSPVTSRETLRSALLLPQQEKSLSGIAIRSFILGSVLALSICASISLAYYRRQVWRAPFFLAALATFHFLEFFITARYNTQFANISAFLLSRNGRAYNIAHTAAMTECVVTTLLLPSWHACISTPGTLVIGFAILLMGQCVRTIAMAQAGTNFNHTVQTRKNEGHQLVTSGLYKYLRHPSYFGFFWWGLGTQLICGNTICFIAYALVLWKFFSMRIGKEEEYLLEFFDEEYEVYRKKTRVGIPFIS